VFAAPDATKYIKIFSTQVPQESLLTAYIIAFTWAVHDIINQMSESCIFKDTDAAGKNQPALRGPGGKCLARPGKEMKNCCFATAKGLLQEGQEAEVLEAVETLRSDENRATTSKVRGVGGALNNRK
jgi:hypothetical protein